MAIDESGWIDLRARLDDSGLPADAVEALIARLDERLVGHFGADVIECHLGKNDPQRHAMREVAAAAIAHLAPLLDPSKLDALPDSVAPPWDDSWRTDDRTKSWRS